MIRRLFFSAVAGVVAFALFFGCLYLIAGFMSAEYDISKWSGQARGTLGTFGGFVSLLVGGAFTAFTFERSER
jgi:hypothetical protein